MSKHPLTRRAALKAAAAALPLAAASQALPEDRGEKKGSVVVGMATTGFREYTNSRLAQELAKRRVHTIQLFLTQSDSNLHAKDRKLHVDRGVPAGQGDLDYRKFVALAAARTPKAPLIMEYVGPKDDEAALAHLRSTLRQVGLSER